mgnify:CR=1 FL=1
MDCARGGCWPREPVSRRAFIEIGNLDPGVRCCHARDGRDVRRRVVETSVHGQRLDESLSRFVTSVYDHAVAWFLRRSNVRVGEKREIGVDFGRVLPRWSGFERGGVFSKRERFFVGVVDDVEHVSGSVCDAVFDE